MLIYLADLYHCNDASSSPTPTNVGYVAAYCIKTFESSVEIQIFKDPSLLLEAINKCPPDILGLSNYMWNERLNSFVAKSAKKKNKDTIIVVGGPNIRTDKDSIGEFLISNSNYDYYILYGAEIPFANLVRTALKDGLENTKAREIEGCFCLIGGSIVGESFISNEKNLDYIPSPFLTGLMDPFLVDGYYPLFETNRGCPFTCTFCVWGIAALGKIKTFSMERVKEELLYVADNFPRSSQWILADANFGIMPRDVEIAKLLREAYDKTNAFDRINIWWSKTISERTYEIAKTLGKLCQAYVAFQSLDPEVLRLIKRSNISVEKLAEFKNEVEDYTNGTYTDILLGLPGETMQSHIDSYYGAMKLGFDQIGGGEVRLLPGSEMDESVSRHEYGLKTKFRVSEGDMGVYSNELVYELEEVIRATNWITEEEMLELRSVRALLYGCTTLGELSILNIVLLKHDVNIFELLSNIIEKRDKNTEFSKILDELEQLSRSEWFNSPEEAVLFYKELQGEKKINDIQTVKLNFWLLGKLLMSPKAYQEFMVELKKAILCSKIKISEEVLDDLIWLSSERNYIRSVLNGKTERIKKIKVHEDTAQEISNAGLINYAETNGILNLCIDEKISKSIIGKIKKCDKLNMFHMSQLMQDFGIDMQMRLTEETLPIAEVA